jgi:hypothetical protein
VSAGTLSVAEATFPSNVRLTRLFVFATTVKFVEPVASAVPLPFVLAKICAVIVSAPTGTLTVPAHGVDVQTNTLGVPGEFPCGTTVTPNEWVLGEI